mgnify:CR=1 FL=1
MTTTFTNRLVGSAILVIAAVVFLPDLLDGQKQVRKDDFKAVPERPEFAEVAGQQVFTEDQHLADRDKAMKPPTETSQDLPVDTDFKTQEFAGTTAGGPVSTDPEPSAGQATPTTDTATTNAEPAVVDTAQPEVAKTTEKSELKADKVAAEQAAIAKRAAEAAKKAEEPVVDEIQREAAADLKKAQANKPLTGAAWIVRVGSFSKEQNANSLVAKLKAAGFSTTTRKIVNAKGDTMVSVVVGPDLKKDKLERSLPQLQQIANVAVLRVSQYQPVENN